MKDRGHKGRIERHALQLFAGMIAEAASQEFPRHDQVFLGIAAVVEAAAELQHQRLIGEPQRDREQRDPQELPRGLVPQHAPARV